MRAGNQPSKTQRMEGEISIVQSIQLGKDLQKVFSCYEDAMMFAMK